MMTGVSFGGSLEAVSSVLCLAFQLACILI